MIVCCLWHFFPVPIGVCESKQCIEIAITWALQTKNVHWALLQIIEQAISMAAFCKMLVEKSRLNEHYLGNRFRYFFMVRGNAICDLSVCHILTQCKWLASAARLMVRLRRHWIWNNFTRWTRTFPFREIVLPLISFRFSFHVQTR